MKNKIFSFSLCLALLSPSVFAQNNPVEITPPGDLIEALNQKYPGFRFAQKKDYCSEFRSTLSFFSSATWSYALLKADFNRDQIEDYSAIIKDKGRYRWVGALKTSDSIPSYDITDFGPPSIPERESRRKEVKKKICHGVFITAPSEELGIGGKDSSFPKNSTYVGFENAAIGVQYYWDQGKWIETGFEP